MDKKKKIMIASFLFAFIVLAVLIIFIIKNNNVYYSVVFETNGGSVIEKQEVKKNDMAKRPEDPIKEGYVFDYWTLDGKMYNFDEKVDKNIVLKAKWIKENKDEITIKFDSNGGSLISDLIIQKGLTIKKPNDPVKEGYLFKGWLLDGTLYNFDKEVNNDITLIASWEEIKEQTTTKKDNSKTTTTKKSTQANNSSKNNVTTTTKAPVTTTRPTTTTTTTTTKKAIEYSYKWVDVAGSTIGQADLYIINKDTGSVVSGTALITYQNGASETVSIPIGGKRFVKSAIKSVSNVKGN